MNKYKCEPSSYETNSSWGIHTTTYVHIHAISCNIHQDLCCLVKYILSSDDKWTRSVLNKKWDTQGKCWGHLTPATGSRPVMRLMRCWFDCLSQVHQNSWYQLFSMGVNNYSCFDFNGGLDRVGPMYVTIHQVDMDACILFIINKILYQPQTLRSINTNCWGSTYQRSLWMLITHPWNNFDGSLVKTTSKLGHA